MRSFDLDRFARPSILDGSGDKRQVIPTPSTVSTALGSLPPVSIICLIVAANYLEKYQVSLIYYRNEKSLEMNA